MAVKQIRYLNYLFVFLLGVLFFTSCYRKPVDPNKSMLYKGDNIAFSTFWEEHGTHFRRYEHEEFKSYGFSSIDIDSDVPTMFDTTRYVLYWSNNHYEDKMAYYVVLGYANKKVTERNQADFRMLFKVYTRSDYDRVVQRFVNKAKSEGTFSPEQNVTVFVRNHVKDLCMFDGSTPSYLFDATLNRLSVEQCDLATLSYPWDEPSSGRNRIKLPTKPTNSKGGFNDEAMWNRVVTIHNTSVNLVGSTWCNILGLILLVIGIVAYFFAMAIGENEMSVGLLGIMLFGLFLLPACVNGERFDFYNNNWFLGGAGMIGLVVALIIAFISAVRNGLISFLLSVLAVVFIFVGSSMCANWVAWVEELGAVVLIIAGFASGGTIGGGGGSSGGSAPNWTDGSQGERTYHDGHTWEHDGSWGDPWKKVH